MFKYNRFVLENGLRVIHLEDKSTPMVVVNTLFDVGARDESPEHTGMAHLFEHLMFGGSANIPSFDDPIQQAGGENNAWTVSDYTNYYDVLPSQNAEIAFWLESDRMLALEFSQHSLDVQKQVVCEEFKQRNLNQPYGDVSHLMRSLVFKQHPYRWPTIGMELSHIENVDLNFEKEFFYSHYAPNNAILTVVGNISLEETERLVEKWYADIPRREIVVRNIPREPEQTEPRFMEVERDVPVDAIYKAYRSPRRLDEGYYVSDLISDILANGRSSRLYQRMVCERKLFLSVDASILGDIEEGLFFVNGKLANGVSFEEADKALNDELQVLCTEMLSDHELEKVKNKYESNRLFSDMSLLNKANNLAYYELLGDVDLINTELSYYQKVSAEDVQKMAKQIFRPENCSTIYYRAKK
ncbi:MAG: insulinase family protein [Paludibacteraceae bacterium]|nr:insulinase family protein [Paludibacteraceae bacterium]